MPSQPCQAPLARLVRLLVVLLLVALPLLSARPQLAFAAAIIVSDGAVAINNDGVCSLIEAVVNANNDTATFADCPAGAGADTLTLGAGPYTIAVVNNNTDGANGLPSITSEIMISGAATIERNPASEPFRIFHIAEGGDLTLQGVMVRNGLALGANGVEPGLAGSPAYGGGIYNRGVVTLESSTVTANTARGGAGSPGDIDGASGGAGGEARGGGIYNLQGLIIGPNTIISQNNAEGGAGTSGAAGDTGVGGNGGAGGAAYGGGIYNEGGLLGPVESPIVITLSNNTAVAGVGGAGGTGALDNGGGAGGAGGAAFGGGLYTTLFVDFSSSTFSTNVASGSAGGAGGLGGDASSFGARGGDGGAGGAGGEARGGAISAPSLDVASSSFTSSAASGGTAGVGGNAGFQDPATAPQPLGGIGGNGGNAACGAISTNDSSASSTLSNSTFSQSVALAGNGAAGGATLVRTTGGNGGTAQGGAICSYSLTITNSSITTATATGGAGGNGLGSDSATTRAGAGGIAQGGAIWLVDQRTFTFTDLAISGARAIGGASGADLNASNFARGVPGGAAQGGAIYGNTLNNLTFERVTITAGEALGGRGGSITGTFQTINGAGAGGAAAGGGIYAGNATVGSFTTLTVTGGSATGGLGGVETDASGTFTASSGNAAGGAIFNTGAVGMSASVVTTNTISLNGEGGGIYNSGTLTVATSNISGNSIASGGSNGGGGGIANRQATLQVSDSIINGNTAPNGYGGGGVLNFNSTVTIGTSTLNGNSGYQGGAIAAISDGTVTNLSVTGSSIGDNLATSQYGNGGGIYFGGNNATIATSTLAGNATTGPDTNGGGLYLASGETRVLNSTFSGNSSTGRGGAIYARDGGGEVPSGSMSINHTTIAYNSAGVSGGGIWTSSGAALSAPSVVGSIVAASIVAANTAPASPDCAGNFSSLNYNLIGNSSGCSGFSAPGDLTGTAAAPLDARLAPLAANGGPTLTHALFPDSPALNTDAACLDLDGTPLATDQRGQSRPTGPACERGAFESGGAIPLALLAADDITTERTDPPFYTFIVTYTDDLAITWSTIDSLDLRVTGPNAYNQPATLVSVNPASDGTPLTAVYSIPAPGGNWSFEDNGSYSVLMQDKQVQDSSGNAVNAGTLGSILVNIVFAADLTISKTDSVETATPGGSVVYEIIASNPGPFPVTGATISDFFPPAITLVSWSCVASGGASCPATGAGDINLVVDLPVGSSLTFQAQATIAPGARGTLTNIATIAGPRGLVDPNNNNTASDTDVLVPQVNLTLQKTDSADPVLVNTPFAYTLQVANTGPSAALMVPPLNTFSNNTPIIISAGASSPGTPYPSQINVSGLAGTVQQLTVTVEDFSHTFPGDMQFLLEGPGGQKLVLFSESGGSSDVINIDLTFDDAGTAFMEGSLTSGTYRPAGTNSFADAGISGPFVTTLADFVGSNPNGAWKLYAYDTFTSDGGSIAGWSLTITSQERPGIVVTDTLPLGLTYQSATGTGWALTYEPTTRTLTGTLDNLLAGASAPPITVNVTAPTVPGSATNTAFTNGNVNDDETTTFSDGVTPVASNLVVADITAPGGLDHTFTIQYSDLNGAIDLQTLSNNDVLVTGPGGFSQLATFVSADQPGNGTPRVVTYRITAPGSSWDAADNGTYAVTVQAGSVADTDGNSVIETALGSFTVTIDAIAPTATLTVSDITTAGGASHLFTVAYSDDAGIDVSTLDSLEVRVTGPGGYNVLASFVSVDLTTDGTPRIATYSIPAPGGSWDTPDNGNYPVLIEQNQVRDITGNPVAAGALGSFNVAIQNTTVALYRAYLPIVSNVGAPDLTVTSVSISPRGPALVAGEPVVVTVVVKNIGNAPSVLPFWVDLYVNPAQRPAVNLLWHQACALTPCVGIAWPVRQSLAPGESITLTSSNGYDPARTFWTGWLPSGTTALYAYADSWNIVGEVGVVAESSESNNLEALAGLTVTGQNPPYTPFELPRVVERDGADGLPVRPIINTR